MSSENGNNAKSQIVIGIDDWREAALRTEDPPQTRSDVIKLALRLGSPREAAQRTIAWIDGGESPEELLPSCKQMLSDGGRLNVSHMVEGLKELFEIEGREYCVRAATAVVSKPEDDQPGEKDPQLSFETDAPVKTNPEVNMPDRGYVDAGTPESLENARRYLINIIPGHVRNRLTEIRVAGGDPRAALEELISILWTILREIE